MTEQGTPSPSAALTSVMETHDHVNEHVKTMYQSTGEYPFYTENIGREHFTEQPNVLYKVNSPIYVHIHIQNGVKSYTVLEPSLTTDEQELYDQIRERILETSVSYQPPPPTAPRDEFEAHVRELLSGVAEREEPGSPDSTVSQILNQVGLQSFSKFALSPPEFDRIEYRLLRDIHGLGPLEPPMADTCNEDVHVIGPTECYVDHEIFGMLSTNVQWPDERTYESWLRNIGERMNHPVSDADPIIDSTLPDGSRINIIYSDDVSVKGPSITIRQAEEEPLSLLQIVKWGTISPELAAYLWLCLENERTVFVVGETAAGKTTTLNAMFTFIPRDKKIYTAEDTAEVHPPHANWQQLLTREGQGDGTSDVEMFDLVAAALRSRPDYICVGEVRGEEAQMAFQAMQTGHPVLLTFHASDVGSMIQRFTGNPINIPKTFMDNCDVALFQNRVKKGDDILRRVTTVQEIEGYSEEHDGIITRQAFNWDVIDDNVEFVGQNNSYVLEEQIAPLLGLNNSLDVYEELERRAEIIRRLVAADITGYHETNQAFEAYYSDGVQALPIQSAGVLPINGLM